MQTKTSIELYDYWTMLRHDDAVPLRRDFEPAGIRHALPALFMLDCGNGSEAVFRLAGTAICDAFDGELRGLSFQCLWQREQWQEVTALLARLPLECDPLLLKSDGRNRSSQPVPLEILLVPLRSQTGICDRVLGCMTPLPASRREVEVGMGSLELKQASAVRRMASGAPFTLPLCDPGKPAPQPLLHRLAHRLQGALSPRQRRHA